MRICIFGASSKTIDQKYIDAVEDLGKMLAQNGHSLIFGGGATGLMGAAARGFKSAGGRVVGAAPEIFNVEGKLFKDCDEFIYPESMRERKKYMEDNADAFIVTPGGIGTYEEFFEVLTLKQLALHAKPIVLFNVDGYFDKLVELLIDNTKTGFLRTQTNSLFGVADNAGDVMYFVENNKTDINEIKFL